MTQGQKEIISIRTISCAFTVLALAIFKPFGFEVWQWEHCAHLLAIFAMGVVSCMVTESILEYLVRMPRSTERGVNYIIRRNLWFQCINTPLVALMICLYRHFVRCHRAFLVNLRQVEQIVSKAGTMQLRIRNCHTYIPVSRSHLTYVKDSLKTL